MSDTTATSANTTDPVTATITAALARVLRRPENDITPDTRLFGDLGLDSTTVLELLMDMEGEFDIEFDADTLEQDHFETVTTLAGYVRDQIDQGTT